MEEDVTRRTVAISVQATKLTGRVLCKAFQKFLAQAEKQRRASLTPRTAECETAYGTRRAVQQYPAKGRRPPV